MNAKFRMGIILTMLVGTNVALMGYSHGRSVPLRQDLSRFPLQFGEWTGQDLPPLTAREQEVLKADDSLWRTYARDRAQVGLLIIYYESQRSGDALHSPKNCLPGSGWAPVSSETLRIDRPGQKDKSFSVNHYRIAKNGEEQDVLYWYQANDRIFASEYLGKIYLAFDAFTKRRTDGALIRITVGRTGNDEQALRSAVDFAGQLAGVLPSFLPQ